MKKVIIEGETNIDYLLDRYNEAKKEYKRTLEGFYKEEMEYLLLLMKTATSGLTMVVDEKNGLNRIE